MISNDFNNFLRVMAKDYWRVAAFYPTPKVIVRRALKKINPTAKYFVEYGAGNGAFTREILNRLPTDGKLLAIEINQDFIEQLKKINDPRLILFSGNAADMPKDLNGLGLPRIDAIVSGIPFSRINKENRNKIIRSSWELLAPGGVFVAYQHVPIVMRVLKKYFRVIDWYLDPRMVLPYFVIFAKK